MLHVQIFVSPYKSYAEILLFNTVMLVLGAFERWLSHEGKALMNINALVKDTLGFLAFYTMWAYKEKSAT